MGLPRPESANLRYQIPTRVTSSSFVRACSQNTKTHLGEAGEVDIGRAGPRRARLLAAGGYLNASGVVPGQVGASPRGRNGRFVVQRTRGCGARNTRLRGKEQTAPRRRLESA